MEVSGEERLTAGFKVDAAVMGGEDRKRGLRDLDFSFWWGFEFFRGGKAVWVRGDSGSGGSGGQGGSGGVSTEVSDARDMTEARPRTFQQLCIGNRVRERSDFFL